jgi:hypothetical protein
VAVATELRDSVSEICQAGIFDVMRLMAVRADGDILIVYRFEGTSMYALGIDVIDVSMALLTLTGCVEFVVLTGSDGVAAMAVHADRAVISFLQQQPVVNAFQCSCVFVEMTPSAAFGQYLCQMAFATELSLGMFFAGEAKMTVHAE